jgi:hypothetical protein
MKRKNLSRVIAGAIPISLVLAGGGTARANILAYEGFEDAVNNQVLATGYQTTTPGGSQGLSGSWTVVNGGNASQLKSRTSSTGWTGAQANLGSIGSSYSVQNGNGNYNFLETGENWNLDVATVSLANPINMTQNGTWFMSFVSSSGNFDYAAQMGLSNGNNELMWGNGYAGGTQGVTAYYGAMSSYNSGGAVKGTSGISPTMGSAYDVMLYVAELDQVVGSGLTLTMYAYDLNTIASLPTSVPTGTALYSTTLTGVNDTFNSLELKLSGADTYPSIGQLAVGTSWGDVTSVPEPGSLALTGCGILTAWFASRRRAA